MSIVIANRYARALADVVGASGNYRPVEQELETFGAVWRASAELGAVFDSPAVRLDAKMGLLDRILERLAVSKTTSNFLRILAQNYRLAMFEEIRAAFRRISNERQGIVEVRVSSAADLSAEERAALAARFREVTGQPLEMEFETDAALIGGLRARIQSRVYDGSVRGHLDAMRERLAVR
ncbi:MAG: ATP synthase F1 subunit delta [Acidobacteria bacterium]|nr:MAG: ATP synthase F1 subunit delta [Acidobacteriota bacterium]